MVYGHADEILGAIASNDDYERRQKIDTMVMAVGADLGEYLYQVCSHDSGFNKYKNEERKQRHLVTLEKYFSGLNIDRGIELIDKALEDKGQEKMGFNLLLQKYVVASVAKIMVRDYKKQ